MEIKMPTKKVKHLWELPVSKGGKPPKFTPEQLHKKCVEYFNWVIENPLMESKLVSYQGESVVEEVPKMRAMTVHGLSLFVGISYQTWYTWRSSERYRDIVAWADSVMRQYKFDGAAAELLNSNIIARDLGLVDKQDFSSEDGSLSPKPTRIVIRGKRAAPPEVDSDNG
jgi:hypothetical protein